MRTYIDRFLRPQSVSNAVLVVALLALALYFASRTSRFATSSNFLTLVDNAAALGIIVVPFTLLVIAGYIDFSVGSVAALSATLTAISVTQWGWSEAAGLALGLCVGIAAGAVNGFLCVILGWHPIIVTLGMLGAIRGATLIVQQDQIFGIGPLVESIGTGDIAGIPITTVIALLCFAAGGAFLTLTPWGRHIFALGANPQAAFLSAIRVKAIPFVLYVVTGAGASLAGIVYMARLNGVAPATTAESMEFQALTIVLLGGVAFAGGRGSLFGVFIAWLFLATLNNGLVLLHVTPYVQTVASGLALVAAAALDRAGSTVIPRLHAWREARSRVTDDPGTTTAPRPEPAKQLSGARQ
ncbi:ABC transporter permease [Gordonia pseudamarae]|jgi:ribose/xylose/arabinose/galactoside ABC-type transport system permease subunit|uniref:ABC transporter permease n=1 Tax=Gordonia pseudamarae TaxID=2831662 RepID=A0ABX6IF67_9ACTN|nr:MULTISPECIES: ABC transporter permease [Gordonia]MBD0022128.1 ABC transporter permease [Gordonia sp. (in: high G+C Gram-positive bacteria)]QHN24976.1 ABC transporter permease [Gordonia pseudamarae]QHN33910.1 ABC transporter permease [Gordonia pseudamarae]